MGCCVMDEREAQADVDPKCLEWLCVELDGDRGAVNAFVATFVRMWPGRLQRVAVATQNGDVGDLIDSSLSIRSSCTMVGAIHLSSLALDLERLGRAGDLGQAQKLIPRLRTVGDRAVERLSNLILL